LTAPRILLSIPLDRCKILLDTRLYRELSARFPVAVVSYLSDRPEFREAYGAGGVHFYGRPELRGRWRWRAYNFTEILRHFAFLFRFRRGATRMYWRGETRYRWATPEDRRPHYLREAVLTVLAWAEVRFSLRRRILKMAGSWIFANPDVDSIFAQFRPTVFVSTAHKSDQEKILAYHASRRRLRSVFIPDSTDSFNMNGDLFHEFDVYCLWGPRMRRHAMLLHGIPENRFLPLGIPAHRAYEELLQSDPFDVRGTFGIADGVRIITYLAIWRGGFLDFHASIDALLGAIASDRIPNAVLLLRTCPWEDPAEVIARYQGRPHIRIQVAANDSTPDFAGDTQAREYAWTLFQSSVIVMSATTGALLQSCRMGIPTIANMVELSPYPEGAFSPRRLEEADPVDIFKSGLPAAHSFDELIDLVNRYLDDPRRDEHVWRTIAEDWDYADPQYVARFIRAVEGDASADAPA